MQLCERADRWSFAAWLLRSWVALDSSARRLIAVGSDSYWKSNCSFSSSLFCWSAEPSLERREEGRWKAKQGDKTRRTNSCQQKESDTRAISSKRCRELKKGDANAYLNALIQCLQMYRYTSTSRFFLYPVNYSIEKWEIRICLHTYIPQ